MAMIIAWFMRNLPCSERIGRLLFQFPRLVLMLLAFRLETAQALPVTVIVADDAHDAVLASDFLGLSYESSMLLPKDGHYYFDATDAALINTFKTLGIKSLRVGANAVDDARIPIPQEKDIDALFSFARAAGVKVIYSFRLKNGDPADSARLASYIAAHYADLLDSFSIGNEPNLYHRPAPPPYETFFAQWKPHYDAILKAVPSAKFDGPSANAAYAVKLAKDLFAGGHLAMASDHHYFLGSGRAAETNAPAARERFLSDNLHDSYKKAYTEAGALLAVQGVPYRMDELNSCYDGGARDSSDTYASALWALDCTHWWAAHNILGMNYHTGESVGRDGKFGAPNYAAFLRQADDRGFIVRPQGYAYLAFSQSAHGRPMEVKIDATTSISDFDAYAYHDLDGSIYVTLINKTHGEKAQPVSASLQLPSGVASANWRRMDLMQKTGDVAAKTDVTFGGAPITPLGIWSGQWKNASASSASVTVDVPPASATILHFYPAK